MTAYVTTTSQKLLPRCLTLPTSATLPPTPTPMPMPIRHSQLEHDTPEMQPMLFRSECFAEDLFDAYPSH